MTQKISSKAVLPELLAPAGNVSCALAAFDAGADAVYAGLPRFNARERTENFTPDEMAKVISYAHRNGKKVYITLNTLIKESELDDLAVYASELEIMRPDAVIVQDLGVLRTIRDFFPSIEIHASTQMGFQNSCGLEVASSLGASRVILERQTTFEELEEMMRKKPASLELEVFIHGALCCCISGSCLLSSWLGGWSGNRGKCKQPCRRRYHSDDAGNGFFLSSQDLCMIDAIPRLVKTGVASLKIEGRLRRADYVENTVKAYRMALEASRSEEAFSETLPKAKELLAKTGGRKWSHGFYSANSAESLIKHDALGVSGILVGQVEKVADAGFFARITRRIHLGDVLRIQPKSGDEGPAVTVTKMSADNDFVRSAQKGSLVFIACSKAVPHGGLVYKTGAAVRDYTARFNAMPEPLAPLDMEITLSRTKITGKVCNQTWEKTLSLDEASQHPASAKQIEDEFSLAAPDGFEAGNIKVAVEGRPFVPASVLKSLRKEFQTFLAAADLSEADPKKVAEEHLASFRKALSSMRKESTEKRRHEKNSRLPLTVVLPRGKRLSRLKADAIARTIYDAPSPHEELVLPFFITEFDVKKVADEIKKFYDKGGRTFRITSAQHFALLNGYKDVTIRTMIPLPVCNSMTAAELVRLGATSVQAWIELEKAELEAFAKASAAPVEIYRQGRPPVLSTRAGITPEKKISDLRGTEFTISSEGRITRLYPEKCLAIPKVPFSDMEMIDLRHADEEERSVSDFNYSRELS